MGAGFHIDRGDEPPAGGVGATFCRQPLVHDAADLAGVDVAVLGAPFDDGTSHRPARASARGRSARPTTAAAGTAAHDARRRPARAAQGRRLR